MIKKNEILISIGVISTLIVGMFIWYMVTTNTVNGTMLVRNMGDFDDAAITEQLYSYIDKEYIDEHIFDTVNVYTNRPSLFEWIKGMNTSDFKISGVESNTASIELEDVVVTQMKEGDIDVYKVGDLKFRVKNNQDNIETGKKTNIKITYAKDQNNVIEIYKTGDIEFMAMSYQDNIELGKNTNIINYYKLDYQE